MIVMAAVDNRKGMMFNRRRISQDRLLREKILEIASGSCLWMDAYSYAQFEDDAEEDPISCPIKVDEDFLEKAGEGEYCFVEDRTVSPYKDRIEQVILFQWNRDYPADQYFDLDVRDGNWQMTDSAEFPGYSHEVITMEVYDRA